tara:strand:+ start:149 stop:760 length:612 start_codon:yes stop_codon:yes gene_type:complete
MNLVALIKPNKKLNIEVKKTKIEVFKKYGNQKYVNHLPHLTIFDLKINKKLINKNHKKDLEIRNLNKNNLRLILKKRFYFANDPITKKNTYVIFVQKNNLLKRIQKKLLKRFKKIILKKNKKFNNTNLNKNYKNYGYPFVNSDWKPHLTIASIKKNYTSDIIFKNFIKKKNIIKENFKFIYFYKYFNGKHMFLWKSKIVNEKK